MHRHTIIIRHVNIQNTNKLDKAKSGAQHFRMKYCAPLSPHQTARVKGRSCDVFEVEETERVVPGEPESNPCWSHVNRPEEQVRRTIVQIFLSWRKREDARRWPHHLRIDRNEHGDNEVEV